MSFFDMARKVLREIEEARDSSPCQAEPGTGSTDQPYMDSEGDLVIPFDSDPRYHWWAGGQSIAETIREIIKGKYLSWAAMCARVPWEK